MISFSDIKEILTGGYALWKERRPPRVRIFVNVPEVVEHPHSPRPADRYHVWGGSKGQNCIIFQVVHWKAITITGARLVDSNPVKWSPIHLSGQQRRSLEAEEPTHYQIRLDQVSAPENVTFVLVSNLREWTYTISKHGVTDPF